MPNLAMGFPGASQVSLSMLAAPGYPTGRCTYLPVARPDGWGKRLVRLSLTSGRVKENFWKETGSVETDRLIKAPWKGLESYRSREEVGMFWAQGLIPLSHEGYL